MTMILKLIVDQGKIHLIEPEFGSERTTYECGLVEYENMVEYVRERLKSVASRRAGSKVRVYRFFNLGTNQFGAEFVLCDSHRLDYKAPETSRLEKISDRTDRPCNFCARQFFNS